MNGRTGIILGLGGEHYWRSLTPANGPTAGIVGGFVHRAHRNKQDVSSDDISGQNRNTL